MKSLNPGTFHDWAGGGANNAGSAEPGTCIGECRTNTNQRSSVLCEGQDWVGRDIGSSDICPVSISERGFGTWCYVRRADVKPLASVSDEKSKKVWGILERMNYFVLRLKSSCETVEM